MEIFNIKIIAAEMKIYKFHDYVRLKSAWQLKHFLRID